MNTRVTNADYMGNIGIAKTIIAPSYNQGPGALENVIGFGFRAFHAFTYQLVGRMSNTFFAVNKPARWDPDEDRPRRSQAENHKRKACPQPLPRHCLAPSTCHSHWLVGWPCFPPPWLAECWSRGPARKIVCSRPSCRVIRIAFANGRIGYCPAYGEVLFAFCSSNFPRR